ncbi:hypothetical protein HPB51_010518 [Rhipicephalus microplus]|uniref:Uncharacterized protein n=1 Tax=Rhipicephalus microplus TaxID=6941 RepID=A0A9J6D9E6_RHIMP|nr:hypothetical protein HPB51_010518 [Rhipicephalus microplus]
MAGVVFMRFPLLQLPTFKEARIDNSVRPATVNVCSRRMTCHKPKRASGSHAWRTSISCAKIIFARVLYDAAASAVGRASLSEASQQRWKIVQKISPSFQRTGTPMLDVTARRECRWLAGRGLNRARSALGCGDFRTGDCTPPSLQATLSGELCPAVEHGHFSCPGIDGRASLAAPAVRVRGCPQLPTNDVPAAGHLLAS